MKKDRRAQGKTDSDRSKIDNKTHRSTSKPNGKLKPLVYEHIPIGIVECSPAGKYRNVNEEFCRLLGYTREELLQCGIKDFTHEDDFAIDIKLHDRLVAGEIPFYKLEKRLVHKGGQIVWVELTRSVARNVRGKALYTVGMVLDITDRHRAEEALFRTRTFAEKTADRIGRLQQITAALTGTATTRQLAELILEQGTKAAGAAAGILVEVLDNRQEIKTIAALGYPASAIRTEPVPLSASTPMSDCILTKRAIWIGSHEQFTTLYPELAEFRRSLGNEALAALPLIVGDRVLGGLAFSFIEVREFNREEQEFFLAVAHQCAQGLERARSEDALRASEERLRLATEAARLCAWELNVQAQTYTLGENFAQVLGFSPDLLPKSSAEVLQLTPAEDIQIIREAVAKAVEGRTDLRHLQYRFINPENGQVIWLEVNAKLAYDLQGHPGRMFGMVQNITESKKLEAALLAQEAELEEVINHTPFMLTRCSRDLHYRFVSRAYAERIGRTPEELVGKPILEIMGEEGLKTILPYIEKVLQGDQVEYETEVSFQGVGAPWLHVVYTPDRDDQGNVTGWFASMMDITERKRAEEALRESEERFRAILSQATAGIVRKAFDGTLLFVNEAFCNMLDYTSSELVGRTCWELTYEEDVKENKRLFEQLMVDGIPFQLERRLIRRDGSILWSNVSVSPIMDAAGKPQSAVGVEVDITARKQAEEALQQLNLELENRVERRTAELRSANQALQKSGQRLQVLSQRLVEVQEDERRTLAQELHDRVGQSLAALNINLSIINNQLSGQATEQLSMRLSDSMRLVAEIIALVRDVMSNLRPSVLDDYGLETALVNYINEFRSRYGIQVTFEPPTPPLRRLGASMEMTLLRIGQEALTNIVRHAQAHQVLLSLQEKENSIRLTVQDDGVGIASWREANHSGSHGLKIMRERAEAFDGDLRVTSEPGKGTKIEAIFPLPGDGQTSASQTSQL
jgi:PAS domain S-box-containing protein